MMVTDFRCWWQNHYAGDFFRYVDDFLNVLNRSPTSQTCLQHIWSPTLVTNTDMTIQMPGTNPAVNKMISNLTPNFSIQKTHRQKGRFGCHSNNCLQPYQSMPDSFRLQNSNLTSVLFTRDPLTRLVSAWKDKIDRVYGHEYYYNHFTKNILAMFHPKTPIPSTQKEAFDQGLTVTFKEFITWISRGFHQADQHWTPITKACNGNFFKILT